MIKPFIFRWRRMLRLALGFERDRRIALAAAISSLTGAENELQRLKGIRNELKERRVELLQAGVDIAEVSDNYLCELAVDAKIESQKRLIEEFQKTVDERREELAERMRERKTYDKLRQRAWVDHVSETEREEMRIVDDIAGIAFERNKPGN